MKEKKRAECSICIQVHEMSICMDSKVSQIERVTHSIEGFYFLKNIGLGLEEDLNFNSCHKCVTLANYGNSEYIFPH